MYVAACALIFITHFDHNVLRCGTDLTCKYLRLSSVNHDPEQYRVEHVFVEHSVRLPSDEFMPRAGVLNRTALQVAIFLCYFGLRVKGVHSRDVCSGVFVMFSAH
jgi:hypothetical protein